MSDIANTSTLWIVDRHSTYLALAPSPTGTPEPIVPAPLVFRVAYVPQLEAEQGDLCAAWNSIHERFAHVGVKLSSSDGLPAQSLLVFTWRTAGPISYAVDGRSFHGIDASTYGVATPGHGMVWESEIHHARLGYFLIGSERQGNLWRVVRVESDYANRFVFTIVPVMLVNGLPSLRLDRLDDPDVRSEVEQHWRDLQNALDHHAHRALLQLPRMSLREYCISESVISLAVSVRTWEPCCRCYEIYCLTERRRSYLSQNLISI